MVDGGGPAAHGAAPPPLRRGPGRYVTVFDPLDGSSNVDANIPTGTIFGVYEEAESMENCMVDGARPPPSLSVLSFPWWNPAQLCLRPWAMPLARRVPRRRPATMP